MAANLRVDFNDLLELKFPFFLLLIDMYRVSNKASESLRLKGKSNRVKRRSGTNERRTRRRSFIVNLSVGCEANEPFLFQPNQLLFYNKSSRTSCRYTY